MTRAQGHRRIPNTLICSGWDGSKPVSMACADNTGLSQHHIVLICAPTECLVTVWMRPADCTYYVPIAYADMSNGSLSLLFAGIFDGIMLTASDPIPGLTARVASVGNTFTPASDPTDDNPTTRRRYLTTNLCTGASAASVSKEMKDHADHSQHQITVAGGNGNVQVLARPVNSSDYVVVVDDILGTGGQALFTGYFDAFQLQGNFSGPLSADIISIGQEILFPQPEIPDGIPQQIPSGSVVIVEDGRQESFSWPIDMLDYSGLQLDGNLTDENDDTQTLYDIAPVVLPDGWYAIATLNNQVLWSVPIDLQGHSGLEASGSFIEVD